MYTRNDTRTPGARGQYGNDCERSATGDGATPPSTTRLPSQAGGVFFSCHLLIVRTHRRFKMVDNGSLILVGAARHCVADGREYRCYDVCGRCSHWMAEDATMRRLYHDTDGWSEPLLPRVDGDQLVANNGQRLERALCNAWVGEGGGAALRDPVRGLRADNVGGYRGGTRVVATIAPPPRRRCPACVVRAMQGAAVHADVYALSTQLGVGVATAYNYVAKGVALLGPTAGVAELVDARLRAAVAALDDLRGALTALRGALPLEEGVWESLDVPYVQLRIARACEEDVRRAAQT